MSLSILNDSTRDATERHFARFAENAVARDFSLPVPAASGDGTADVPTEVAALRERLKTAHGSPPRFIFYVGTGGAVTEKIALQLCGLLRGGPRVYFLDSNDPEKLKAIADDMQHRAQEPFAKLLPGTLVVSMEEDASPETALNLEKLRGIFRRLEIESGSNFVRLSGTTGSLYSLALAGADLKEWIAGSALSAEEIAAAFKLASFLQGQREAGRDKVTLLPPKSWTGIAAWSRRILEPSGLRLVISERLNIRTCHTAQDPKQDRVFLAIQRKGEPHPEGVGITSLRAHKYPLAVFTFAAKAPLSRYMRFLQCVAFALDYLQPANTSPDRLPPEESAGVFESPAWKQLSEAKKWRGVITGATPETLADAIRTLKFSYAELAFFGDTRYSEEGAAMKRSLNAAAQCLFRSRLKMPANVGDDADDFTGAADCFSLIVLSRKQSRFNVAQYDPDSHVARFLAAKAALEQKSRAVRAILVKDLSEDSLSALEALFRETANSL